MLYLDENNFEQEVLKSSQPVLVDFFATWCGPCKMVSPLLDQVSEEMKDKVKVCKIDIDQNPNIASKYGVMSIPTFIMYKDGKDVAKNVGALPKSSIEDFINNNL